MDGLGRLASSTARECAMTAATARSNLCAAFKPIFSATLVIGREGQIRFLPSL
jgi:hypothetical protein